ncbi:hypothetical protein BpHYR1_013357 [Brachionus plicatilis]|uniref:Uncharacterized protein n=1 Tax=Brachionus plicatilis TaxID=10195 RepID=A0A3M7QUK7_BRAPC|nr:hypothetical protein BpHYR1_013357 [Brachionus plicatilis]
MEPPDLTDSLTENPNGDVNRRPKQNGDGNRGIKQKTYEIEKVSYQNPKPSKMAILECDKIIDKPKKLARLLLKLSIEEKVLKNQLGYLLAIYSLFCQLRLIFLYAFPLRLDCPSKNPLNPEAPFVYLLPSEEFFSYIRPLLLSPFISPLRTVSFRNFNRAASVPPLNLPLIISGSFQNLEERNPSLKKIISKSAGKDFDELVNEWNDVKKKNKKIQVSKQVEKIL